MEQTECILVEISEVILKECLKKLLEVFLEKPLINIMKKRLKISGRISGPILKKIPGGIFYIKILPKDSMRKSMMAFLLQLFEKLVVKPLEGSLQRCFKKNPWNIPWDNPRRIPGGIPSRNWQNFFVEASLSKSWYGSLQRLSLINLW